MTVSGLHTIVINQRRFNMYKIITLFGASGSGKDTIMNKLLLSRPSVNKVIPYMTRPPREYEINGIDGHFISSEEFLNKIADKQMIEYTLFNGWYYGTGIDTLREDVINIGTFDVTRIMHLQEDERCEVFPFLVYAPNKFRLLRNLNREDNPNCYEICRRFLEDSKDLTNIPFDYIALDNSGFFYSINTLIEQIEFAVGFLGAKKQ